jgi:hypothetical protein
MKKFLKFLMKHYNKPFKKTEIIIRFYLQATTFSYELHDNTQITFTDESLLFESCVFNWWDEIKEEILLDIKHNVEKYEKTRIEG